MTTKAKARTWRPDEGDACQGDVVLFVLPDSVALNTSDEIAPDKRGLILAEGEVTGHHHIIGLPRAALFRDDGLARTLASKAPVATARLYRDAKAVEQLMRLGELTTDALAIGFLVVEGGPVVLRHDEHDPIRIPPGRYYVGGQREFDAAQERRVQD